MNKNSPPIIAATARTPTTAPAAMAATFGLVAASAVGVGVLVGVTRTVLAGGADTEVLEVEVGVALDVDELDTVATSLGILFKIPAS